MGAPQVETGAARERLLAWRRLSSRWRPGLLTLALALGVLIGLAVGRATAPSAEVDAARVLEELVLPIVIDADSVWTSASDDRAPVAEALVALRRDGDPTLVHESYDEWIQAYDSALLRLAGVDLPATARPVQRQLLGAIALSRDAVEVLGHAADVADATARQDLTTEVGRLRQRSEQLTQSARASISDLTGQRADVAPPGPLTDLREGRR